ncbi:MAG: EamA family transporter [Thermodesulfobacteriota bacterium]|jgi:drug/metabolite transporter (DMT)-like permease
MKEGQSFILFLIVLTSLCDTFRELFLKSGVNSLEEFSPDNVKRVIIFVFKLIGNPRVWVSLLFGLLSLLIWLFILSKVDLNFAFSLDSMHYIFIALASQFLLKEKVKLGRWVGTFLIVLGITLVTLS